MTATKERQRDEHGVFRPSPGLIAAEVLAAETDPPITVVDVTWTAVGPGDALIGYMIASDWDHLWTAPEPGVAEPIDAVFECPVDHQRYYSAETMCSVSQTGDDLANHDPLRVVAVPSP